MAGDWQVTYRELKRFVNDTPEIVINSDTVAIPEEFRPRFYNQLNMLGEVFLIEELPSLLGKSEQLHGNYQETKKHVFEQLGLNDISLPANLDHFLINPVVDLVEVSSESMFDLLKDETSLDTFIQAAVRQVEGHFTEVYRPGYQVWIALSILSLLEPGKVFQVSTVDLDNDPVLTELDVGGIYEGNVAEPEEAQSLSFRHPRLSSFIVPDVIIQPVNADKYIAIRTELSEASWRASSYSDKREWHTLYLPRFDYSSSLPGNGLVIYIDYNINDLTLVSDFMKVCRPELIVQCLGHGAWQDAESLERIIFHHKFLNPILGTFVVTDEPVSDWLREKLHTRLGQEEEAERIHFLDVEFNRANLVPIIDAIMSF